MISTSDDLLKVALGYLEARQPVIAVRGDKTPYGAGWNEYFNREQTEEEVREQFSNGARGIARVLYPACEFVILDFDGDCADDAWRKTKIELPDTARISTPSGGHHLLFRASPLLKSAEIKRKVRIVEANCKCKPRCGVDFLIRGYALIPPTPGYSEDPDFPIECAVQLPDDVVRLATNKKTARPKTVGGKIPEGRRNVTLLSIGGVHRRQGKEYDELVRILWRENESRCQPPLDLAAVETIAKSLCRYEPAEATVDKDGYGLVSMDTILPVRVEWLWDYRIPIGRLTQIVGDPGVGKSFLALDIAATVSRGGLLPGNKKSSSPSHVLLLSIEDGPEDTIRPRLDAMKADASKIIIPDPKKAMMAGSMNADFIEWAVKQIGPILVILDPIISFAAGRDTNQASQVREFLSPLMTLAERYAFACLINGHLNKQSNTKAIYRGSGSIDFIASCRSGFVVAEDKEDPTRRILAHTKSNLAPRQPSLSFYIDDKGFRWGEEVNITADDLLSKDETRERTGRQLERAREFLEQTLKPGPMKSDDVKRKADGISKNTLWRAKEDLQIQAKKQGIDGPWWWRLPYQGEWPWTD